MQDYNEHTKLQFVNLRIDNKMVREPNKNHRLVSLDYLPRNTT